MNARGRVPKKPLVEGIGPLNDPGNELPEFIPPSEAEPEILSSEELDLVEQLHFDIESERIAQEQEDRLYSKDRSNQILVRRCIDPHEGPLATWIMKWVDITPSICVEEDCGYDAAIEIGFTKGYESIPERLCMPKSTQKVREFARSVLKRHKAAVHTISRRQDHIRTKEQAEQDRYARMHQLPEGFVENPSLSTGGKRQASTPSTGVGWGGKK